MPETNIPVNASVLAVETPDPPKAAAQPGDLNDELIGTDQWSDDIVARAGIPIVDARFLSIGGGIGSFAMVNHLRAGGLGTESIKVLSNTEEPTQTYEYLTRVSQIPRPERLRSDSTGMPDCLWAWPSYAFREARKEKSLGPLWSVLTEPVFVDYWTPRAATVFEGVAREADRMRWWEMVAYGQARMVRKRVGGGYFSILTPPAGTTPTRRVAYRSQFVHIAVGYPGLKFLPDLQAYRERYGDLARLVNAYEPHEHVYESLQRKPSVLVVRGGGIVASRVLQRAMEDRWNKGAQTRIIHLFRTYIEGKNAKFGPASRTGGGGFAYQGFNWPKGAWGGQLRDKIESLEGDQRAVVYKALGGTHTPKRKLWQQQMKRARDEGWYQTIQGEIAEAKPTPSGLIGLQVNQRNGSSGIIEANAVIDCTGLEADLKEHRLLADLLEHSGVGRNVLGRLDVERSFELRNGRSGTGRLYASGAATLGAYYLGVDSFLGLQYAAMRILDDVADAGLVPRLTAGRSVSQWWKWFRHQPI